jgi:D-3-phosphoglycerate dehydrogenase
MKILVATEKPFAPAAIEQIRAVAWAEDYELGLLENYKSVSEFQSAVSDADALIGY